MSIENIVLLVLCIVPVAAVAIVAVVGQWKSASTLRSIVAEQGLQLMSFHQAGQSMAAHQLEMARISAKEREAEANLARARADEARITVDREMRAASSGRFNGSPRIAGET